MLYVDIADPRCIAGPIAVVAAKIQKRSFMIKQIHNAHPKAYLSKDKVKLWALRDSKFKFRSSLIFPDELTADNRVAKIKEAIERLVIIMNYYFGDTEITMSHKIPSPRVDFKIHRAFKNYNLSMVRYLAEQLRYPYLFKADQAKPLYEFLKNKGQASENHYLTILEWGLTRHHHSVTEDTIYKFFKKRIKDSSPCLEQLIPYFDNPPYWWDYHFETPFLEIFKKKDIERARYIVHNFKRPKEKTLFSPRENEEEPSENFSDWLSEHEPEDFDLPFTEDL